jgi:hypothetical protein
MDVDSEDAHPTPTSIDDPSATPTSLRGPETHDTGFAEPFVVEPPTTEPLIKETLIIEPLIAEHSRIESPVSKLSTIEPAITKPLLTHRTNTPILLTEPTITEPLVTTLPIAKPSMNETRLNDSNISSFHPAIADAPAEDPYSASIWGNVLDICDDHLEKLAMEHAPHGAEEAVVAGDTEGMNNRVVVVEYLPKKEKRCIRIPASGWEGKWSEMDRAQLTRYVHIMTYLKEQTQIPIPEIFHWDCRAYKHYWGALHDYEFHQWNRTVRTVVGRCLCEATSIR